MEQEQRAGQGQRTYYVDDEPQQTTKEELTVQRILEKAGVRMAEEEQAMLWELRGGERVEHTDPNERIRIENDARFVTQPGRPQESMLVGEEGEGSEYRSSETPTAASPATPGNERAGASRMPTSGIMASKPGENPRDEERSESEGIGIYGEVGYHGGGTSRSDEAPQAARENPPRSGEEQFRSGQLPGESGESQFRGGREEAARQARARSDEEPMLQGRFGEAPEESREMSREEGGPGRVGIEGAGSRTSGKVSDIGSEGRARGTGGRGVAAGVGGTTQRTGQVNQESTREELGRGEPKRRRGRREHQD